MNRLFFRPEQCGMTKTDATVQTLHGINPDVRLEGCAAPVRAAPLCAEARLAASTRTSPPSLGSPPSWRRCATRGRRRAASTSC